MNIKSFAAATIAAIVFVASGVTMDGNIQAHKRAEVSSKADKVFRADATAGEVRLSWEKSDAVETQELLRDGIVIFQDTGEDSAFLDYHFDSSSKHSYTLKSTFGVSQTEALRQGQENLVGLDIRSVNVEIPKNGTPAEAAGLPTTTYLTYRTFLPGEFYLAPPLACSPLAADIFAFRGDNRGFSPTDGTSRTQQIIAITWAFVPSIQQSRTVGMTWRYRLVDGVWKIYDFAQASNSTILLTVNSINNASASFRIMADVVDPLCNPAIVGGVYYDFNVVVNRAGSYSLYGYFVQVPNQEIYLANDMRTTWTTVAQMQTSDILCLAKPYWYGCGASITQTGTY